MAVARRVDLEPFAMTPLAPLLPVLRTRPGLYLPDDRFQTLVAFVRGFELAEVPSPLAGFQDYVVSRLDFPQGNVVWWSIIAGEATGAPYDGAHPMADQLREEADHAAARGLLIDLITEVLARPASEQ